MDCIILCGGFATRLKRIIPNTPKILALINGKPFIYYILKKIEKIKDVKNVIFATGYLSEQIKNYCSQLNYSKNFIFRP